MQKTDILISVPLTEYNSMEFKKEDALIREGNKAAASKAAVLSAFSVDDAGWQEYLDKRIRAEKKHPLLNSWRS